jgi:hypothetical protein
MANTYTQCYFQLVFAVKNRNAMIKKSFREKYLEILLKNEIEFKDEYVFEFFDDVRWD